MKFTHRHSGTSRGASRALVRSTAVIGVLALGLASCGSDSGSGGNADGPTFVDYNTLTARPSHIDPALASEVGGGQVAANLYDGLTEYDFSNPDSAVLKPLVAEKFASNAEATEWTFTLKPGQVFSNGDPVLPSSFAYAWNRLVNPKLAAAYSYLLTDVQGYQDVVDGKADTMSGVVADDTANTLTVKLTTPNAEFPGVASLVPLSPVPEKQVSKLGPIPDTGKWEKGVMIGNGPFVEDGKPDLSKEIVFTPNKKWAGDIYGDTKPKIGTLVFKVSKSIGPGYSALQAGEAQSSGIPDGKYAEVQRDWPNTIKDPQLSTYYFDFGMDHPDLGGAKNLKLRQAVGFAINRDRINKSVYDDSRIVATGFTPPGVSGYKPDLCKTCSYNPTEAKKLVKEWQAAGGTLSGPIKVQFGSGQGHEDLVNFVVDDLKAVGIEAEAQGLNADTYFANISHGACELCRTGWGWDYPSFYSGLTIFTAGAIAPDDDPTSEGNNPGRFDDPKYDEMITKAIGTIDDASREQQFRDAESYLLNDQAAAVPIVFYGGTIAYAKNVTGLVQNPLSFVAWERVGLK